MSPQDSQAAVLGLVQGLCEFLPVSSSGHLALAQALYGFAEPEVFFDLVLHLGTLAAVCLFYRREVLGLVTELRWLSRPAEIRRAWRIRPVFRLGVMIVIGSVPTAVMGLLFEDFLTSLFASLLAVGLGFLASALVLSLSRLFRKARYKSELEFPAWAALVIGLSQGIAIAPGISRSGMTICVALILGLEGSLAARYSFLLSIPAILGGLVLKFPEAEASGIPPKAALLGFAVAAVSGLLALKLLTYVVRRERFHFFAPWCLAACLLAFRLHGLI
ncbi:MAG: undecaprenyl-diphosphate phosphatase [Deltaproteobacteria bacterium]|nr:undecaprenyl-diphosphate phosphatase [Deltaproteobacteria bacterium]